MALDDSRPGSRSYAVDTPNADQAVQTDDEVGAVNAVPCSTPPYSTPSGSASSRFAMYARSASSTASSIGGGS